jgi:hypothetical protein
MSQNRSNAHLFYLSQDHIAIEKLLTFGIGLGTLKSQLKARIGASKAPSAPTAAKDRSKLFLLPHRHFIEHLMSVTEKT